VLSLVTLELEVADFPRTMYMAVDSPLSLRMQYLESSAVNLTLILKESENCILRHKKRHNIGVSQNVNDLRQISVRNWYGKG